jgi:cyclohexanone monooxygenase
MTQTMEREATQELGTDVDVLILGGGICGIGTAIALQRDGFDVLVLEKAEQLGGTWRENTYPGCACDIPSHLYSFPFAPNPDWSRGFAGQAEIQDYVLRVAAEHGIPQRTRFGTEVLEARWEDAGQRWVLETTRGTFTSRAFVLAAGPLHEPVLPDVAGTGRFRGFAFHSSRWAHDHDFTGERVAVIGTGASTAQFVPHLRREAASVHVFQRTPAWVMPKLDWRTSRLERALLRRIPALTRALRLAQWAAIDAMIVVNFHPRVARLFHAVGRLHMRRAVRDRRLRRILTPRYVIGCKRVLVSNDFYPALAQPDVEVIPEAVAEVREHSVVGVGGTEREVDTVIYATGFHVTDLPVAERVRGRDGRTLADVWQGSPRAYLGTAISGFPNAFMLFGPNVGSASAFVMLDAQLRYVTAALRALRGEGLGSIDVRPEVQDAFKAWADRRLEGTTWLAGGCSSYYIDAAGRNAAAWPGTMASLRRRLSRFELSDYACEPVREPVAPAGRAG